MSSHCVRRITRSTTTQNIHSFCPLSRDTVIQWHSQFTRTSLHHPCSCPCFPVVGGETGHVWHRSSATAIISFRCSLSLAFSLHFPLPLLCLSSDILAVAFLIFYNLLVSLSPLSSAISPLSYWPCVQSYVISLYYSATYATFSSNFFSFIFLSPSIHSIYMDSYSRNAVILAWFAACIIAVLSVLLSPNHVLCTSRQFPGMGWSVNWRACSVDWRGWNVDWRGWV